MCRGRFAREQPAARMRPHEAHFPAEQPSARPYARVPDPHEHPGRPCSAGGSPRQGSHSNLGLTNGSSVLPGGRRIRRSEDFRKVMRAGVRAASRTVVVHVCATDADHPSRAGFVVGRSVGQSVVRNRVTRQLRHLMAPVLEGLPPGTDVVVRALPAAASASGVDLGRDLSSALRRVLVRLGQPGRTGTVMSQ